MVRRPSVQHQQVVRVLAGAGLAADVEPQVGRGADAGGAPAGGRELGPVTPFSADAQERIRGKCPLELAGYEVQKLPVAQLFRGLALPWPASAFQELVSNV